MRYVWDRSLFSTFKSSCNGRRIRACTIGSLHDLVTWHEINYTGTQITQSDFQNKGKSGWTGTSSFVLEVPLRNLRPRVIYSVPCDRIVQRAFLNETSRRDYPLSSLFVEGGGGWGSVLVTVFIPRVSILMIHARSKKSLHSYPHLSL